MEVIMQQLLKLGMPLLLAGCAFSSVERPNLDKYQSLVRTSESFKISEAGATRAAEISLKALGYDVDTSIPELGLLKTKPRQVIASDVCDCGKWNGREISGTASSLLQIQFDREAPDAVTVKIKHVCATEFTGRNLFGIPTHHETYQCASRGIVESKYWDLMRRAVQHQDLENQDVH
jgi:hypothetical protein